MSITLADWLQNLSKRTDHLYLNDGDPYVPHNFNARIMHIKLNYAMPRLYKRGIYDDISCEFELFPIVAQHLICSHRSAVDA